MSLHPSALQVWEQVFQAELGPPPAELYAPCCAEFVVSADRIRAHSLAFYVHLRDWILTTELDTYRAGRGAITALAACTSVLLRARHRCKAISCWSVTRLQQAIQSACAAACILNTGLT